MNHSFQLRKLELPDLIALQRISVQTFIEAFAHQNTSENMRLYLEQSFSLEKLAKEITNPHSSFYGISNAEELIAYCKLNVENAQSESLAPNTVEMERLYVLKSQQGKGWGKCLIEHALYIAHQKSSPFIWLGVWEKNESAIGFYKKLGFREFGRHVFMLGQDEQTDSLMRLDL
ncbi:MAG: hypothetical protein RLZZ543_1837 [Bacteroidota bacterium]|jgi:ribosomal protein S18 acetylase RimI-like enzyme